MKQQHPVNALLAAMIPSDREATIHAMKSGCPWVRAKVLQEQVVDAWRNGEIPLPYEPDSFRNGVVRIADLIRSARLNRRGNQSGNIVTGMIDKLTEELLREKAVTAPGRSNRYVTLMVADEYPHARTNDSRSGRIYVKPTYARTVLRRGLVWLNASTVTLNLSSTKFDDEDIWLAEELGLPADLITFKALTYMRWPEQSRCGSVPTEDGFLCYIPASLDKTIAHGHGKDVETALKKLATNMRKVQKERIL